MFNKITVLLALCSAQYRTKGAVPRRYDEVTDCQYFDHNYVITCEYANLTQAPLFDIEIMHSIRHLSLMGNRINHLRSNYTNHFPNLQLLDLREQLIDEQCVSILAPQVRWVRILTDCSASDTSTPMESFSYTPYIALNTTNSSESENISPAVWIILPCASAIICILSVICLTKKPWLSHTVYSPMQAERSNPRPISLELACMDDNPEHMLSTSI